MHLIPSVTWFLAGFHAAIAVAANSGIVEVDLVFPRNDTYAPIALFPIVFAIRNSSLAQFVNPYIEIRVRNSSDRFDTYVTHDYDLRQANFSSSDPYFESRGFGRFKKEDSYTMIWTVRQQSCLADRSSLANYHTKDVISNNTIRLITFTIKNAAQEVDLVSATNKDDVCLSAQGVAINITDTVEGLLGRQWWGVGDTCAVVASPTPIANPCQIKLDSATAARISASVTAAACRLSNPIIDCPTEDEEKNNAQHLAVGAMSLVAVALGAFGFLLI
ncbi:hypothetical protein CGCTS75_v004522 [Colletotrichum tropicale]|nr:hypothetical protein CGCTS75_v004522 [Colletotrichum tropicale]